MEHHQAEGMERLLEEDMVVEDMGRRLQLIACVLICYDPCSRSSSDPVSILLPAHRVTEEASHRLVDTAARLLAPIRSTSFNSSLSSSSKLIASPYRLWSWFTSVDTDRSGSITAPELGSSFLSIYV